MNGREPRAEYLGDSCLLWTWPGGIDLATSETVLAAYRLLRDDADTRSAGALDIVPAYCSLAIHFDPSRGNPERLRGRAEALLSGRSGARHGQASAADGPAASDNLAAVHHLPVVYDGEDLERVARHTGLDVGAVAKLHAACDYRVAMVGFLPHFPYLIGMDTRLATPRLASPRRRVPAGSVGIAGGQTGVYPCESPGGWNLIGSTDPGLLAAISPGDRVVFEEVPR